jgi:hypothetical protein
MLTKFLTLSTLAIALFTLWMGFTQQSAFVLRQENQDQYWGQSNARTSGSYIGGRWQYSSRENYEGFRGGGPGTGK